MAVDLHTLPIGATEANREDLRAVGRIPGLDGLRGLAVAAVVAYHAWPDVVPGGWLGVSLFFTLSGFLITGILIREHTPTRQSLGTFWLKRARRLLPAALAVIAAAAVGTALVDPDSLRRVAGDALASIAYVQNWREAAAPGGYGAIFDTGLRPLAHMWSLAIEEQVYVFLPLLTLALGARRMLVAASAIAVLGTVYWWGSADAYYATPVRLVEVVAGAALAVWVAEGRAVRIPRPLVVGAIVLAVAGVFGLSESHDLVSRGILPFSALVSAIVIASVLRSSVAPLTAAPVMWLGHRSYAIYLFHWPLLVLLDVAPVVAVGATLVLAEVSHHVLEGPIRSRRIITRRPARTFVLATGAAAAFAVTMLVVAPREATDSEIAAATAGALRLVADEASAPETSFTPVAPALTPASPSLPLDTGAAPVESIPVDSRIALPESPTVLVAGDSTAESLEPAVTGWLDVVDGSSLISFDNGCSPMFSEGTVDRWFTALIASPTACRTPVAPETDLVLVFDHGTVLFDHFDREADAWTSLADADFQAAVVAEYERVIAGAADTGAAVVFTTQPTPFPDFGEWPELHSGTDPVRRASYRELVTGLAERHDNVHLLDIGPVIDADPARYPREDGMHLDADTGAINAVVDLIAPAFRLESN